MISTDVEDVFALPSSPDSEYIAWEGNPLEFGSKIKAISQAGKIEIFH